VTLAELVQRRKIMREVEAEKTNKWGTYENRTRKWRSREGIRMV
jgi:hypothetical protein